MKPNVPLKSERASLRRRFGEHARRTCPRRAGSRVPVGARETWATLKPGFFWQEEGQLEMGGLRSSRVGTKDKHELPLLELVVSKGAWSCR